MMTPLLDDYLALRRAAGFQLQVHEVHLRNFVKFAAERGEALIRTQTALDWAALAPSASQRGHRLDVVRIFARYARIEDSRHEVPPLGVFSSRRPPYRPFIFIYSRPDSASLGIRCKFATHRLITAVDLLHVVLAVGGHRDAHFRGIGLAFRGCHAGWFVDPEDKVPEEPASPAASEHPGGAGAVSTAASPFRRYRRSRLHLTSRPVSAVSDRRGHISTSGPRSGAASWSRPTRSTITRSETQLGRRRP